MMNIFFLQSTITVDQLWNNMVIYTTLPFFFLSQPSVLALAVLTHELPNASCEVHNPNDIRWIRIVWDIQRVSQVNCSLSPECLFSFVNVS